MNSLSWVKLFNAAVSESEGSSSLIITQGAGASTSHFAYEDERSDSTIAKVTVQTVVFDKLVECGEIRPTQFIKVDVEGHGAKALLGARQTIAAHRPTIVMSFHSQWELDDTREILEPLGYRSFTAEGKELEWPASIFRTTILRC